LLAIQFQLFLSPSDLGIEGLTGTNKLPDESFQHLLLLPLLHNSCQHFQHSLRDVLCSFAVKVDSRKLPTFCVIVKQDARRTNYSCQIAHLCSFGRYWGQKQTTQLQDTSTKSKVGVQRVCYRLSRARQNTSGQPFGEGSFLLLGSGISASIL
jgi:hypothetical protein